MTLIVVTGSGGLIGSATVEHFAGLGYDVVGIDNNMRKRFFGEEGSTSWNIAHLSESFQKRYAHHELDIRDRNSIDRLFRHKGRAIAMVVHTAAQPSHDWAAREPFTDFDINAVGTLNLLEATRHHSPEAVFVYTSTNKVYGDRPNRLPLSEHGNRYEIDPDHVYANGIDESMSVDTCMHSLFGVSKLAADVLVQEYGKYFGMPTACLRGGTLSGPSHSAAELHGFLAYIMRCVMSRRDYTVFGYAGKQVRDVIHCDDVVRAFECFIRDPPSGEVYNIGGGRHSNCSVLEAIELCQEIAGETLSWKYLDQHRKGDHIWWIGDNSKLQQRYPEWQLTYDLRGIALGIFEANVDRWQPEL